MVNEPATLPSPSSQVLDVDPRFVLEVAQGIEDPAVIAARYGIAAPQWEVLRKQRPFRLAVAAKMSELKAAGYTFRMKAALMAEELLVTLFDRVHNNEKVGTEHILDAAKWLTRVGNLEPKEDKNAAPGGGFTININLGEQTKVVAVQ